ncbi:Methyltransferase FUS9 [Seminavis robusta]|uniref:Methyltransferase FUS9 n=1 Tax=Seminavis robusta TaxID=568900 RepID=A0A9N8DJX1_9STRA|nr:Methyltransferase FUS9 [Seminavis robusta]|eukprot:Sro199_g084330.1 Methyltransferase FUS9 (357) ;mRNA; r:31909-32979
MTSKDSDAGGVMAPMTGDYNKLNASQSTVWKYAKPLFANALQDVARGSTFRVADLGCATGGNSVAPLAFVASHLHNDCALEVFLGDLPQNAWSAVVTTVTPESITGTPNGDRSASNTFVYMVGRTFYESCTPPGTLDLNYSLVAVHWMKSYAGDVPTGLYATDPLHTTDPELLQAWRTAGAQDFADFTRARHRELKLGGRFIGAVACPKENGDYPWSKVGKVLHDALLSKVESPQVIAACVLPCCWRTRADVEAGFAIGWQVEALEFHETKDPVREQLEQGGVITPTEYATAVVESFKSVGHPTYAGALAKTMPQTQVDQLLAEAYKDCIDVIAADPEQYNLDVSFWYVVAKKTSD